MPIKKQIEHHATRSPHKKAFVIGDQARTYGELFTRSKSFAAYVDALPRSRKAHPLLDRVGKLVVLCLGNHIQFPELFIATTEYPFACAVLDPNMKAAQIEDILARLQPDLVVTTAMHTCEADIATRMELPVLSAAKIECGNFDPGSDEIPKESEIYDDTFLVSFTSGTTSLPKAFTRSRGSWRASLKRSCELFGLTKSPAAMCPGALAHGLALYALVETLYSGGTFHTVDQWNPDVVVAILASGDVQRLIAVPTMIAALTKASGQDGPIFPTVKDILTAGAKLTRAQIDPISRTFPAARIMEYYGASELGFVTVSQLHLKDPSASIETVGKAFPGVEITIRNPDTKVLGPDRPGTIYVKSDLIADGYLWGDDGKAFRVGATGATVGDIGQLGVGGALKVLGREGGMVVTGGNNVYPSEIENVLKNLAGVQEAIVLGLSDSYLGARLVAVLLGDFPDLETILEQAAEALPRYKIPRDFYRTHSWPLTTSGKIARRQVERAVLEGAYEHVRISA